MKKNNKLEIIMKGGLVVGILLYAVYAAINHFIALPDVVAIPCNIIIILLILSGVTYQGLKAMKGNQKKDEGTKKSNQ